MWLSWTKGYRGISDNEKMQFKFLETFQLSSLWFNNNLSKISKMYK